MNFVREEDIDKVTERINSQTDYARIVQRFKAEQPVLLAFLFSENFNLLTRHEQEYMMFLALIIWESACSVNAGIGRVSQSLIEETEEKSWQILNSSGSRIFKERIDPFFNNYPQEDLLAFVEDSLVHDDDSEVTKEGREYIFVGLKTMIDCLHIQG